MHSQKIFFLLLLATFLFFPKTNLSAKNNSASTVVHIPFEVVDSLKKSDLGGAIRSLRMEASSPKSQYILRSLQNIVHFESEENKHEQKIKRNQFNTGVAYHNLYLFLKNNAYNNKDFYNKAMHYYKSASRTPSPTGKNKIRLTTAALFAAAEDHKNAQKLFSKVDPTLFKDEFEKSLTYALYYSAIRDTYNAILNIKSAYQEDSEYTKLWVGISDDFYKIQNDPEFITLLKQWGITPLIRGGHSFSKENKEIVK